MSSDTLLTNVLPVILTGLRGRSLPTVEGTDDPLALLALSAAALRLGRPEVPESFEAGGVAADRRHIVSDKVRPLLLRLAGAGGSDDVQSFVARELDARGLRPHPFAFPLMEDFVSRLSSLLGASASAYAEKNKAPAERRGYFEADERGAANWSYGNRRQRADYLRQLRRDDPAQGRELLVSVWSSEDPETRLRLLPCLLESLSGDDAEFLTLAVRDRSPRVKAVATALLAKLPGHEGDNPVLREIAGRIRRSEKGLKLERPANVGWSDFNEWIANAFSNFGLAALAEALSASVDDLIHEARGDERLLAGILVAATVDQDVATVGRIARAHLPTMGDFALVVPIHATDFLSDGGRMAGIDAVSIPENLYETGVGEVASALARICDGALPTHTAERLLSSQWLRRSLATAGPDRSPLTALVILTPRPCRRALVGLFIDVFGSGFAGSEAATLIEFLTELETDHG